MRRVRRFVAFESVARRKLRQLQIAGRSTTCGCPGESAEALKGDRAGQSASASTTSTASVSLDCRRAEDVEIVDYH